MERLLPPPLIAVVALPTAVNDDYVGKLVF